MNIDITEEQAQYLQAVLTQHIGACGSWMASAILNHRNEEAFRIACDRELTIGIRAAVNRALRQAEVNPK